MLCTTSRIRCIATGEYINYVCRYVWSFYDVRVTIAHDAHKKGTCKVVNGRLPTRNKY